MLTVGTSTAGNLWHAGYSAAKNHHEVFNRENAPSQHHPSHTPVFGKSCHFRHGTKVKKCCAGCAFAQLLASESLRHETTFEAKPTGPFKIFGEGLKQSETSGVLAKDFKEFVPLALHFMMLHSLNDAEGVPC